MAALVVVVGVLVGEVVVVFALVVLALKLVMNGALPGQVLNVVEVCLNEVSVEVRLLKFQPEAAQEVVCTEVGEHCIVAAEGLPVV